uniref:Uncharacterized protein LOC111104791 isoform X2 n=1 Tax=Crassostrea virginica TaxID=6565 RepID=A0A8B8AU62_CRAVI|nr:uncharacterized protein LOC111104791 isoform X2 [Crassostrea virginica]
MVVHIIFVLILSSHHFNFKVLGQNACNEDKNVLNSCDGSIVSNDDIYIDFGVIKNQCSCTVEHINNVNAIYTLSEDPGYIGCGTGIQITKSNNDIETLRCSNVITNLSTTVEFKNDYNSFDEYCLRVYTNDVSHIVNGSCGTSATNLPMTSTDLSMNPTKIISTHLTEKDTGRTEAFTSTSNFLIIAVVAGALLILIVIIALTVKILRHRDKNKLSNMPLKDEVTDDLDSQRVHLQPEDALPLSTESNKTPNSYPYSEVDNRGSGLWVVENTLYKSADNVINDSDNNGIEKKLVVSNTVYYSEINDNENNGTTKLNMDFVYDYAHAIDEMP